MDAFTKKKHELIKAVDNLEQEMRFCLHDYDYHHRNDERQIIEHSLKLISEANAKSSEFTKSVEAFRSTLDDAQRKCDEIDAQLMQLGVIKKDNCATENVNKEDAVFPSFADT